MAENHPNEHELLSFVEEELDGDARRDVSEHLVACRSCADQIRSLEAARDVLRASPPLELPDERREEIFASLPERQDPWRRFRPVKRALVIAAPAVAAAALVAVVFVGAFQLDSGGDDDRDAAEATADAAGADERAETGPPVQLEGAPTATAEEAAPATDAPEGATLVRLVQGPPAEIVRVLAAEGIEAEVDPGGGVVAEARAADVRAALADRATGSVPVYVR